MHRFSPCGPLIIDGELDGADPGTAIADFGEPTVGPLLLFLDLDYTVDCVQSAELTNRRPWILILLGFQTTSPTTHKHRLTRSRLACHIKHSEPSVCTCLISGMTKATEVKEHHNE